MKKMMAALAAVTMAMTPAMASAQSEMWGRPNTGNKLYAFCKEDAGSSENFFCYGYVGASLSGLLTAAALNGKKLCFRDEVTTQQYIDVFLRYARNHPDKRDGDAYILMSLAFLEAWPCR